MSDAPDRVEGGADPTTPPAAGGRACPYLAAEGRGWRSAAADREHRCTAVVPPAALTLEKQRRLCLIDEHRTCATYLAALAARGGDTAGAAVDAERVTRWAITRTTPVLLDHGRIPPTLAVLSPFRRGGQVALGGLMVVALGAVLAGRLAAPDEGPAAAVASPSPTPVATPTSTPTARATPTALPATPSPTPTATPAPTPAPTPLTYTVRSGDTLSRIANQHDTTVAAIVDLNGITDPSRLRIGQVLLIPLPTPSP